MAWLNYCSQQNYLFPSGFSDFQAILIMCIISYSWSLGITLMICHSPSSELSLKYFLSKDPTASCLADITMGNDKQEMTMPDTFCASLYTESNLNVSGIWCITSRKFRACSPEQNCVNTAILWTKALWKMNLWAIACLFFTYRHNIIKEINSS